MRRIPLALLALAALALGLAACGSSSSETQTEPTAKTGTSTGAPAPGQPGKGKPAVTLGDKNFTEEFVLGELYKQALEAKGYKIKLKKNIGSSEIIDKALTSGKIDMYPEYTGVIVQEIQGSKKQPKTAQQTYDQAKKFQAGRGFTLTNPTPFEDKDVIAVRNDYAAKNKLKSITDLKKIKSFTFAAPPENKNRYAGVKGLKEAYGLTQLKFKPLTIGVQYQALDQGKVDTATVFTTDGQLLKPKYTLLADPKAIFGFQNVAMVVKPSLLKKEGPAFAQTINAVSAKLTVQAIQEMNAAVDVNKLDPKDVAQKFLQSNSLLNR